MQTENAVFLRKMWGNKPCEHPSFAQEYNKTWETGDYICTECGRSFPPDEKNLIIANSKKAVTAE